MDIKKALLMAEALLYENPAKQEYQSMIAFYSSVPHCCRMELAPILSDRSLRAVAKVSQGHDPPPFWIRDVFKRTAAKL
jgi:hypothetical protein